jgi:hypothetical protein
MGASTWWENLATELYSTNEVTNAKMAKDEAGRGNGQRWGWWVLQLRAILPLIIMLRLLKIKAIFGESQGIDLMRTLGEPL